MKVLLDENFPLALYRRLREAGVDAEHIIVLGERGLPDSAIRKRLLDEDILLLTQDTEFLDMTEQRSGTIIVSRVPQHLPIAARVDIWFRALERFDRERGDGKTFELFESGALLPSKVVDL